MLVSVTDNRSHVLLLTSCRVLKFPRAVSQSHTQARANTQTYALTHACTHTFSLNTLAHKHTYLTFVGVGVVVVVITGTQVVVAQCMLEL